SNYGHYGEDIYPEGTWFRNEGFDAQNDPIIILYNPWGGNYYDAGFEVYLEIEQFGLNQPLNPQPQSPNIPFNPAFILAGLFAWTRGKQKLTLLNLGLILFTVLNLGLCSCKKHLPQTPAKDTPKTILKTSQGVEGKKVARGTKPADLKIASPKPAQETRLVTQRIELREDGFYIDAKKTFLVGTNYRGIEYKENFGSERGSGFGYCQSRYYSLSPYCPYKKETEEAFAQMKKAGIQVVRINLFDDGTNIRTCENLEEVKVIEDGREITRFRILEEFKCTIDNQRIRDYFFRDIKVFLDLAQQYGIKVEFTLFDYLLFSRGLSKTDLATNPETMREFMRGLFIPILQEFGHHPALFAIDIINEPEWIVLPSVPGGSGMVNDGWSSNLGKRLNREEFIGFIREISQTVRSYAPNLYITMGISLDRPQLAQLVSEYLDYYAWHHFEQMPPIESLVGRLPKDKPWILEEFPTGGVECDIFCYLDQILEFGGSGGFFWNFKQCIDQATACGEGYQKQLKSLEKWLKEHRESNNSFPRGVPYGNSSPAMIFAVFGLLGLRRRQKRHILHYPYACLRLEIIEREWRKTIPGKRIVSLLEKHASLCSFTPFSLAMIVGSPLALKLIILGGALGIVVWFAFKIYQKFYQNRAPPKTYLKRISASPRTPLFLKREIKRTLHYIEQNSSSDIALPRKSIPNLTLPEERLSDVPNPLFSLDLESTFTREARPSGLTQDEKLAMLRENWSVEINSRVASREISDFSTIEPTLVIEDTKGKLYFLKNITYSRGAAYFVTKFLSYLRQNQDKLGFSIPRLVPTKQERYFVEIEVRGQVLCFVLEEAIAVPEHAQAGRDVKNPSLLHFRALGEAVAKLHNLNRIFSCLTTKYEYLSSDVTGEQAQELKESARRLEIKNPQNLTPAEKLFLEIYHTYLLPNLRQLEHTFSNRYYRSLPWAVCHGDFSLQQSWFTQTARGPQVCSVIDFNRAKVAPRLEDIKNAVLNYPGILGKVYNPCDILAFVSGYQQAASQPLSEEELLAIPDLLNATFILALQRIFVYKMTQLDNPDSVESQRLKVILENYHAFLQDRERLKRELLNLRQDTAQMPSAQHYPLGIANAVEWWYLSFLITSQDQAQRQKVIHDLGILGTQEAEDYLIAILRNPKESIALRKTAIFSLGLIAGSKTIPVLIGILKGRCIAFELKAQAALALARIFTTAITSCDQDLIKEFLRHELMKLLLKVLRKTTKPEVQTDILEAIGKIIDTSNQVAGNNVLVKNANLDLRVKLALKIAQSRFFVGNYPEKLKVGFVVSLFRKTRMLTREEHPFGEDYLRVKIKQLEDLFKGSNISWELILVDDGTLPDGDFSETGKLARTILASEYPHYYATGQIKVLSLQQAVNDNLDTPEYYRSRILGGIVDVKKDSQKGGNIIYGLDYAINQDNCYYVFYTDSDLSFHLGQAGLLLETLVEENHSINYLAIGSRRQSQIKYHFGYRSLRSLAYQRLVRLILGLDIQDPQAAFQGYNSRVLMHILADCRDRRFSFTTELQLLSSRYGKIKEIEVAWIDSPWYSGTKNIDALKMLWSILQQKTRLKEIFSRVTTLLLPFIFMLFGCSDSSNSDAEFWNFWAKTLSWLVLGAIALIALWARIHTKGIENIWLYMVRYPCRHRLRKIISSVKNLEEAIASDVLYRLVPQWRTYLGLWENEQFRVYNTLTTRRHILLIFETLEELLTEGETNKRAYFLEDKLEALRKKFKLSKHDLEVLRLVLLLHDIGKIDYVSEEQIAMERQHPLKSERYAQDILEKCGWSPKVVREVCLLVRCHSLLSGFSQYGRERLPGLGLLEDVLDEIGTPRLLYLLTIMQLVDAASVRENFRDSLALGLEKRIWEISALIESMLTTRNKTQRDLSQAGLTRRLLQIEEEKQTNDRLYSRIEMVLLAHGYLTTQEEKDQLRSAYVTMIRSHRNRYRKTPLDKNHPEKGNVAESVHLLGTALVLAETGRPTRLCIEAILHDIKEDTATSQEALVRNYGVRVDAVVEVCSKPPEIKSLSKSERERIYLGRLLGRHLEAAHIDWEFFTEAHEVKIADRINNLENMDVLPKDEQWRRVFFADHLRVFIPSFVFETKAGYDLKSRLIQATIQAGKKYGYLTETGIRQLENLLEQVYTKFQMPNLGQAYPPFEFLEQVIRERQATSLTYSGQRMATVVAFEGFSGAGKSVFVGEKLVPHLERAGFKVVVIHVDWFLRERTYRDQMLEEARRAKQPLTRQRELFYEWDYFERAVLEPIWKFNEGREERLVLEGLTNLYSHVSGKRDFTPDIPLVIDRETIVLIEGQHCLQDRFIKYYGASCFVFAPKEVSLANLLEREQAKEQLVMTDRRGQAKVRGKRRKSRKPSPGIQAAAKIRERVKIIDFPTYQQYIVGYLQNAFYILDNTDRKNPKLHLNSQRSPLLVLRVGGISDYEQDAINKRLEDYLQLIPWLGLEEREEIMAVVSRHGVPLWFVETITQHNLLDRYQQYYQRYILSSVGRAVFSHPVIELFRQLFNDTIFLYVWKDVLTQFGPELKTRPIRTLDLGAGRVSYLLSYQLGLQEAGLGVTGSVYMDPDAIVESEGASLRYLFGLRNMSFTHADFDEFFTQNLQSLDIVTWFHPSEDFLKDHDTFVRIANQVWANLEEDGAFVVALYGFQARTGYLETLKEWLGQTRFRQHIKLVENKIAVYLQEGNPLRDLWLHLNPDFADRSLRLYCNLGPEVIVARKVVTPVEGHVNLYPLLVPADFQAQVTLQHTVARAALRDGRYELELQEREFLPGQRKVLSERLNQLTNITNRA
ncbi:MAG: phosphotransferase, partial [Candidatus Omnitrophota bacterium]